MRKYHGTLANSLDHWKDSIPFEGHGSEVAFLDNCLQKERLHSALLFTGPKGVGKYKCALGLAKYLTTRSLEDESQSAVTSLQVERLISPNVRVLNTKGLTGAEQEKQNRSSSIITVESTRKMIDFLRRSESNSGHRVAIIDDADCMNLNAANACLKILEEPCNNSTIILIAHNIGKVLATIRSRTIILQFSPIEFKDFQKVIEGVQDDNLPLSDKELANLYTISKGSVSIAQSILKGGGMEINQAITEVIDGQISSLPFILEQVDSMEKWTVIKHLLLEAYNRRAHESSTGDLHGISPRKAMDQFSKVLSALHEVDTLNLSRKYTVQSILMEHLV